MYFISALNMHSPQKYIFKSSSFKFKKKITSHAVGWIKSNCKNSINIFKLLNQYDAVL